MTTTVLLLALLAIIIFYFYKKTDSGKNNFKELSNTSVNRVIRVYDMDMAQLKEAVESFHDFQDADEQLSIHQENGHQFLLTFPPTFNYIDMCYWVNFLVYSDEEKKTRHKAYGWYPFGEVQVNGKAQPFSNQTVMMYVDKDDTECDNVSFVTPDGKHYLQSFAISNNLKALDNGSEKYIPLNNE